MPTQMRKSETSRELVILPDLEAVAQTAAKRILALSSAALATQDWFSVAFSGGSTPRRLYETLAEPPYSEQVPWERVHVFWGDERCVPPDDPSSNYHMLRESLLDHVPMPAENIHRVLGELEADAAACAYAGELRDFFDAPWPTFDVILLGMGEDGHTASLFPGSRALGETTCPVVGVTADYQNRPARRVTLTPRAINSARNVIFLVTGAKKANVLRAVLEGPYQPKVLPAQIMRPTKGHLVWLMDSIGGAKVKHLV